MTHTNRVPFTGHYETYLDLIDQYYGLPVITEITDQLTEPRDVIIVVRHDLATTIHPDSLEDVQVIEQCLVSKQIIPNQTNVWLETFNTRMNDYARYILYEGDYLWLPANETAQQLTGFLPISTTSLKG